MPKTLVIVESPGKIAKIQSYLGNNYIVKASFGHILAVNPKGISIDLNTFEPKYIHCFDKKDVIKNIKIEYKKADDLLIATDLDREGEMIAWSIAHILNIKNPKRISFNDITKQSILKAVSNPSTIDFNMVNAQKCRTMLDKIIGYDLSSIVKSNINSAKSAGRVQSVVVRLIVDKENEIEKFITKGLESEFKTKASFSFNNSNCLNGNLYFNNNIKCFTKEEIKPFYELAIDSTYKISNIFTKPKIIKPAPPFTTATLQQEASKKYKFSAKNTMIIAQKLYEEGLITYMRTDSVNLSEEAMIAIKSFIVKEYGKEYYKHTQYQNKGNSQEAHEAIRMTDPNITPNSTFNNDAKIGPNEIKLYSLIWKRTIASQLQPATFDVLNVHISISKSDYHFVSQTETCTFKGYLIIKDSDNSDSDKNIGKEKYNIGDILNVVKMISQETYKEPPSRYNEASLINKLDVKNLNIGRPSTYASILNKICDRDYVQIKDIVGIKKNVDSYTWIPNNPLQKSSTSVLIYEDKQKLVPTDLGKSVSEYLIKHFSDIMEYKFTATMEKSLDDIALNKINWLDYMKTFYKNFAPLIKKHKIAYTLEGSNDNGILLGNDDKYKYYKCTTKYGPVIKKVNDMDTTYHSIKLPYLIETITFDQAKMICIYPYILGQYDNKDIIIKNGESIYFTYDDKNYKLINDPTLEACIEIIKNTRNENKDIELSDAANIYYIKTGPHGKYLSVCNKKKLETQKKKGKVNYKQVYTNYKIYPAYQNLETYTLTVVKEIVKNAKNVKKIERKKV